MTRPESCVTTPIINNVAFKSVSEIFIAYARMEISPFGGGKTSGCAATLWSTRAGECENRFSIVRAASTSE